MLAALLIAAAAALLYSEQIKALVASLREKAPKLENHHYLALACLAGAALLYWPKASDGEPTPSPVAPDAVPAGPLSLGGLFTGPTAAADAAALAALCAELADKVEQDGTQSKPRLSNGWQIADLRTSAREIRLNGDSIGIRQPLVRDAVHRYLDNPNVLGKAGGPIGPQERARWVTAFRDIARAAEAEVR